MSQLTRGQVLDMRAAHDLGVTIRELSRRYDRSESCVSGVVNRRTYQNIRPGEVHLPMLPEEADAARAIKYEKLSKALAPPQLAGRKRRRS